MLCAETQFRQEILKLRMSSSFMRDHDDQATQRDHSARQISRKPFSCIALFIVRLDIQALL